MSIHHLPGASLLVIFLQKLSPGLNQKRGKKLLLGEGAKEPRPDPRVPAVEAARRDPSQRRLRPAHEVPAAGLRPGARESTEPAVRVLKRRCTAADIYQSWSNFPFAAEIRLRFYRTFVRPLFREHIGVRLTHPKRVRPRRLRDWDSVGSWGCRTNAFGFTLSCSRNMCDISYKYDRLLCSDLREEVPSPERLPKLLPVAFLDRGRLHFLEMPF